MQYIPEPPKTLTDSATFLSDVTLPDGTVVSAGQALVKTWRVRNSGTSTWGSGYQLVFVGGDQMGAPNSVNLPRSVAPGETVDISVNMTAPSTGGSYQGNWRMRNAQGVYFGDRIWVKISVPSGPTPPPSGGTGDIEVQSVEYPSVVTPGQRFRPRVTVKVNQGQLLQSRGDMLRNTDGNLYGAWPHVAVVGTVNAGSTYIFEFYENNPVTAPSGEGAYQSKWRVWRDGSWAGPEITIRFDVRSGGGTRPNPPTLVSPSNWHYSRDGSTPTLCAQSSSLNVEYKFQIYESAQNAESNWMSSNCWAPPALGPYTYRWRAKVKDRGTGLESNWSETWHFSIAEQQLRLDDFRFQPSSPSAAERVRVWTCLRGFGEVNIGLKIEANTATDGSASGDWYWIHHLGTFCYPQDDPTRWPEWETLPLADGTHLIRATGFGPQGQTTIKDATYTLLRRKPPSPQLLSPIGGIRVNSRTITFRWASGIRGSTDHRTREYQLLVSAQDDPAQNPILNVTLTPDTTSYTHTFDEDHSRLRWRVIARNELGESEATTGFGIDRVPPSSTVTALPLTTTETRFTVQWGGSDDRSGIRWYDVQYRDGDRGGWTDWQVGVTQIAAIFSGQAGHTYYFRARALDNAGNLENWPTGDGDTHTMVDPTAKPPTPWWNTAYGHKRNLLILNNDSHSLPAGYPIRLHFDNSTTPTASELYNASQSSIKGDDFRIIYTNQTELPRFVQTFQGDRIDIWFNLQASIGPSPGSDCASYQLYYGNPNASASPGDPGMVFPPTVDGNTVGLWRFQDGSGTTITDSSGNGYHASIMTNGGGGYEWSEYGKFGRFLRFYNQPQDGNGYWAEVSHGDAFSLSQLTVEAWIRRDVHGVERTIVAKRAEPGFAWQLFLQDGHPGFDYNYNRLDVGRPLELGRWCHLAATYDGLTMRLYQDGELIGSRSVSIGPRSGSGALRFGKNASNNNFFPGAIQHVRISNVARSSFPHGRYGLITAEPSLAAGDPIGQPITGAADLTVLNLAAYPNPGGGVLVQTIVRNEGNVPTQNGFFTDLYANHLPVGPGDYTGSIRYWVASPIAAGQTITLTTVITGLTGAGSLGLQSANSTSEVSGTLYAQTDSTGALGETNEANNISSGTQVCIAGADAYERDDAPAVARSIGLGQTQHHNSHVPGEQDWTSFVAQQGVTYTIRTTNLGLAADTYLYLYDSDGSTLLAANDDTSDTLASQIQWTAPRAGTYYILVKHWNPNISGCGTGYDLQVTRALVNKAYLPLVLRNR